MTGKTYYAQYILDRASENSAWCPPVAGATLIPMPSPVKSPISERFKAGLRNHTEPSFHAMSFPNGTPVSTSNASLTQGTKVQECASSTYKLILSKTLSAYLEAASPGAIVIVIPAQVRSVKCGEPIHSGCHCWVRMRVMLLIREVEALRRRFGV